MGIDFLFLQRQQGRDEETESNLPGRISILRGHRRGYPQSDRPLSRISVCFGDLERIMNDSQYRRCIKKTATDGMAVFLLHIYRSQATAFKRFRSRLLPDGKSFLNRYSCGKRPCFLPC